MAWSADETLLHLPYLGPADRAELQVLLNNRNSLRKLTWRAEIVLATAGGQGTVEIMRRTGMATEDDAKHPFTTELRALLTPSTKK